MTKKRSPRWAGLNPFLGGDGGDSSDYAYINCALQHILCNEL
jgi:hypothetical protein